jgi:hypothetical protein
MASVTGAQPPPNPPPGGGSPAPTGGVPPRRTCIRHPNRELSAEEIAAGYTRCAQCLEAHRLSALVNRVYFPSNIVATQLTTSCRSVARETLVSMSPLGLPRNQVYLALHLLTSIASSSVAVSHCVANHLVGHLLQASLALLRRLLVLLQQGQLSRTSTSPPISPSRLLRTFTF